MIEVEPIVVKFYIPFFLFNFFVLLHIFIIFLLNYFVYFSFSFMFNRFYLVSKQSSIFILPKENIDIIRFETVERLFSSKRPQQNLSKKKRTPMID